MNTVERKIRLRADQVRDFVAVAGKCDFDIDIYYNRYTMDAKSFLGVMGLDLTRELTVAYDGYNYDFEMFLKHLNFVAC